jgi:hypothetical protein
MRLRNLALVALGLSLSAPAFAAEKHANAGLAAAERAYQAVDFPGTREQAQHTLEAGGATPQQTARLHVLLGISAAALGDVDDAKQHFVAALAVDPRLRLDKSLSPKIRDPYLEARGYWSAAGERLGLRASPTNDRTHLVARLQDPASLVSDLQLRLNATGSREITELTLEPTAETRFAVPARLREHDYEYVLRALDRYGNVISECGSDADPELVRQGAHDAARSEGARGRSYLLPVALAVTGLGAVAAGVVFNVKREQAAHEWNGPGCENPGSTRQQQCESVDSRIQSDERLTIGFYAGGGALIAGSVIALLAGRPAPAPTERASAAVGCSILGPGVSCLGHF